MNHSSIDLIGEVSAYIARSGDRQLSPEVVTKTKHHILDTLAAMISGSQLRPGKLAKQFGEKQLGREESQIICSSVVTTAINAAFVNGIMAHADETDDFIPQHHFHPGSVIVPSALAVAEREEADGMRFLNGVVVGYDIGIRLIQALDREALDKVNRNSHCLGGTFGAAAAASSILQMEDALVRHVLSYAAQQASGLNYWTRDEEHIEKAFLFSGMPARNGVTAALMVQEGFTGLSDSFSGENNLFEISSHSRPEILVEALGGHFAIMDTYMKKYSVGGPIQSALEALSLLMEKYHLGAKDVQNIVIYLPSYASLVSKAKMPDVNLPYIFAVTLIDGTLSFEMAHSYERMHDPEVIDLQKHVKTEENKDLFAPGTLRQAIVEVKTKDGIAVKEHVKNWPGTAENPMTNSDVEKKCRELIAPVLGTDRAQKLIEGIWKLEDISDMRKLRHLMQTR